MYEVSVRLSGIKEIGSHWCHIPYRLCLCVYADAPFAHIKTLIWIILFLHLNSRTYLLPFINLSFFCIIIFGLTFSGEYLSYNCILSFLSLLSFCSFLFIHFEDTQEALWALIFYPTENTLQVSCSNRWISGE